MATREQIIDALSTFANQRPGLDPSNYTSAATYRRESRRITQQLSDFRRLLEAVRWRTSIDVEQLKAAFGAYSGRLTLEEHAIQHTAKTCPGQPCGSECDHVEHRGVILKYCTGQYWPTEYRAAACAVLAAALWDYTRANMPEPVTGEGGDTYQGPDGKLLRRGDWIRTSLRREFGRHIARRWFE